MAKHRISMGDSRLQESFLAKQERRFGLLSSGLTLGSMETGKCLHLPVTLCRYRNNRTTRKEYSGPHRPSKLAFQSAQPDFGRHEHRSPPNLRTHRFRKRSQLDVLAGPETRTHA